jgi:hypothetical protein
MLLEKFLTRMKTQFEAEHFLLSLIPGAHYLKSSHGFKSLPWFAVSPLPEWVTLHPPMGSFG